MPNIQTEAYIRSYIEENIRNDVMNFAIKIATFVLEWTITLAVGYEVQKITSDEKKDIWTFAEFFGVLALCVCIWIIKCCCLNKFCINCCINCFSKKRNQEDIEMGDDDAEGEEKMSIFATVLGKIHMILNRLAIGAIGFELRKQLFNFKPLTNWDYIEISLIGLFCLWILTIKYCILKCYCLKCCCPCCFNNEEEIERIEVKTVQNQAKFESMSAEEAETVPNADSAKEEHFNSMIVESSNEKAQRT